MKQWLTVFRGFWGSAWSVVVVCIVAYSIGSLASGARIPYNPSDTGPFHYWRGTLAAAIVGLGAAILWIALSIDYAIRNQVRAMATARWECRITETEYAFKSSEGVTTSIPFAIMKLELEDPDAWLVTYGKQRLVVFRKSLREFGLEELFMHRLQGARAP